MISHNQTLLEGTGQEGFFLIFRPINFIFGIYMYFGSNKKKMPKKIFSTIFAGHIGKKDLKSAGKRARGPRAFNLRAIG